MYQTSYIVQQIIILLPIITGCWPRDMSAGRQSSALPAFDPSMPRNVTAMVGRDALLTCIVTNIGNSTVSWIRQSDLHVLTVDGYTYTNILRFEAVHEQGSNIWQLLIKPCHHQDAGVYDCQVSTIPVMTAEIQFNVVTSPPATEKPPETSQKPSPELAVARILGGDNVAVQQGNDFNLTCEVSAGSEPTISVEWLHQDKVVSFTSARGSISVRIAEDGRTISELLMFYSAPDDAGRYECRPVAAAPASAATAAVSAVVTVYVTEGGENAAINGGCQRALTACSPIMPIMSTMFSMMMRISNQLPTGVS